MNRDHILEGFCQSILVGSFRKSLGYCGGGIDLMMWEYDSHDSISLFKNRKSALFLFLCGILSSLSQSFEPLSTLPLELDVTDTAFTRATRHGDLPISPVDVWIVAGKPWMT